MRCFPSTKFIASLVVSGLLWAAAGVHAAALYSGLISGVFSAPVVAGTNINADGSPLFLDNALTAVFSGDGTATFSWGTGDPNLPPFQPDHSTLQFAGAAFSDMQPDEVFRLGTLTYTNGASLTTSVAFGITLSLKVTALNVTVDPAVAHLTLLGTVNQAVPDPIADADFVTFDVLPFSFHVFEGATATADLFGSIHGDPQLLLTQISLSPGQPGFLASEPVTNVLVLAGLGVLVLTARRKLPAA